MDSCIPIGFLISEEKKPICVSCKQEHLVIIYYPLYILAAFYFGTIFPTCTKVARLVEEFLYTFSPDSAAVFTSCSVAPSVFTHL